MKVVLETQRLILREWTFEDLNANFALCGDAEVMRYIGDGRPFTAIEQSRAWIEKTIAAYQRDGFGRWAVVDKARDKIIGSCGFGWLGPDGLIDLSFLLARDCWGRGLASEAAGACLGFGFARLNFPEVTARVAP